MLHHAYSSHHCFSCPQHWILQGVITWDTKVHPIGTIPNTTTKYTPLDYPLKHYDHVILGIGKRNRSPHDDVVYRDGGGRLAIPRRRPMITSAHPFLHHDATHPETNTCLWKTMRNVYVALLVLSPFPASVDVNAYRHGRDLRPVPPAASAAGTAVSGSSKLRQREEMPLKRYGGCDGRRYRRRKYGQNKG